jgi:apolipoprotein N-acyltransferase
MSVKNIPAPGKAALFLVAFIFITLIISFPLFSFLLFAAFPVVFELIGGERIVKQIIMLVSLAFAVCFVVFANAYFFPGYFVVFLILALYFTVLIGADFLIVFHITRYKYALFLIFGYTALSRFALCLVSGLFPFYWTLTMHLLPFMGATPRFILPLFWEALCVVFAAQLYFIYARKVTKHMLLQAAALVLAAFGLSGIVRAAPGPPAFTPGLECAIVQGGYSRRDYDLIDRHPVLAHQIAQNYLAYIEQVLDARFVVLPESAFPLMQIEGSEIMRKIQDIARLRNRYIMTGILLEEGGTAYNATALINPEGRPQNVYRKRSTVPFVETSMFSRGIGADTFTVDGHIIAPVICYESLFIRDYLRERKPELYIVISNDVFAEGTVLARLHQAYAVINARTLGTPLLQAMQNGPSFYVDSQGVLTDLTMPHERVTGLPVEIQ